MWSGKSLLGPVGKQAPASLGIDLGAQRGLHFYNICIPPCTKWLYPAVPACSGVCPRISHNVEGARSPRAGLRGRQGGTVRPERIMSLLFFPGPLIYYCTWGRHKGGGGEGTGRGASARDPHSVPAARGPSRVIGCLAPPDPSLHALGPAPPSARPTDVPVRVWLVPQAGFERFRRD